MSKPQAAAVRCQGKDAFPSAKVALAAAPKKHAAISAYRCDTCGAWHLGSHIGPRSRNKSQRVKTRNGVAMWQEDPA